MNIQIFGRTKCFDTKKAQRYFKERGVKFQFIDLKEKPMSKGEFTSVCQALGGWEKLVQRCAINSEYSARYLRQNRVCESRRPHYAVDSQTRF